MSKLDSKSRNLVSGTILIMLCSLFITKEEEKALGISEHNTVDWRRQNNIPDTELGLTRKRSDTVSTAHSDSHDQKRNRWEEIKSRYYYKTVCSRICKILLYFSNLIGLLFRASAQPLSQERRPP